MREFNCDVNEFDDKINSFDLLVHTLYQANINNSHTQILVGKNENKLMNIHSAWSLFWFSFSGSNNCFCQCFHYWTNTEKSTWYSLSFIETQYKVKLNLIFTTTIFILFNKNSLVYTLCSLNTDDLIVMATLDEKI